MSPDQVQAESDTSRGVLHEAAVALDGCAESRAQAVSDGQDGARKSQPVQLRGRGRPRVPQTPGGNRPEYVLNISITSRRCDREYTGICIRGRIGL